MALPAAAHDVPLGVRNVLDGVAPHIDGVTIQVVRTVADQLVVENRGSGELEVLAPTGEAFLRIGPNGVLANVASPSWYLTNSVEATAVVPPSAHAGAPPQWFTVSSTLRSWGWFDHRLHPPGITVQPVAKPQRLLSWTVPMRYDGNPLIVRGHLEFRIPIGFLQAHVDSMQVAPGVSVVVAQGHTPAFVLTILQGSMTVIGEHGEPFLRATPDHAEVNEASPTWALTAAVNSQVLSGPVDAAAPPRWHPLPTQGALSWLEPRARAAEPPRSQQHRTKILRRWSVPMLVNGRSAHIRGFTEWVPLQLGTRHANRPTVVAIVAALVLLVVVGGAVTNERRASAANS